MDVVLASRNAGKLAEMQALHNTLTSFKEPSDK